MNSYIKIFVDAFIGALALSGIVMIVALCFLAFIPAFCVVLIGFGIEIINDGAKKIRSKNGWR